MEKTKNKMSKIEFLQGFLRSPREVGSVVPSSRFMIKRITNYVKNQNPKSIVEFGAGTGVITKELSKVAGPKTPFLIFEKDDQLRESLTQEFSNRSIHSDALDLPHILDEKGIHKAECIVSGLPLTLFPKDKTEEILQMIHSRLEDNGTFIIYQYSSILKKRLDELFDEVNVRFVPLNIPPTFIYFCKKR